MKKAGYIIFILLFGTSISFSQDLKGKSGREKSKIAKKERKEAKKDKEFVALMDSAHTLFADNKFDDALKIYEKAKARRPLNIYPKVKIEDILLAKKNYDEDVMKAPEVPITPEVVDEKGLPEIPEEDRIEKTYEEEIEKAEKVVKDEVPPPPSVVKDKKEDASKLDVRNEEGLKPMTEKEIREELGRTYEDGIYEYTFEEGKKTITERIIVKNGLGDLYRKVVHQWGGKFYFKNNNSISENTWMQTYK
ncbi:MAG: hypothetical protein HKN39_02565 [Flavobacteriales bacterium]|nr:hypothetical protein [Flavobacteriales bacterium]